MELQQQIRQRETSNRTQFGSGVFALFPIIKLNIINFAGNDDFNSGQLGGFIRDNSDSYGNEHGPDYQRHHQDAVPESLTSPRRVPAPSVRNGFNPPDLGAIVQKERQQLEYADMLKQQMREREESKAAAKHAKRIEEEAELERAPQQPVKSFAKQKVSGLSLEKRVDLKNTFVLFFQHLQSNILICGSPIYICIFLYLHFRRLYLKHLVFNPLKNDLSCWKSSVFKWKRKGG